MSIMRSWPASPRCPSCAPRSNSNPAPNPNRRPEPDAEPDPEPQASITTTSDEQYTHYRITLPHLEAAKFDAALASHRDALAAEWKRDHDNDGADESGQRPPRPSTGAAFMRLVEAGWDAEAARRPHGQHTTVVVHVDVKDKVARCIWVRCCRMLIGAT